MPATVQRIEYDLNRSAFIALVKYEDGELRYIAAPVGLKTGDTVVLPPPISSLANRLPPISPSASSTTSGDQPWAAAHSLSAPAGDYAQLMAKRRAVCAGPSAVRRSPSRPPELHRSHRSGRQHRLARTHIGKAGRTRHAGHPPDGPRLRYEPERPPHGGGEGKSPVGHPGPMTPWGKWQWA